tara:strand:+ start:65 stop:364 length:300 start_codon:yes stop_codon:yes gene_type:complete
MTLEEKYPSLFASRIEQYQLRVLIETIKLEGLGIKSSRGSALAVGKKRFGLKGNRKTILEHLEFILDYVRASSSADLHDDIGRVSATRESLGGSTILLP